MFEFEQGQHRELGNVQHPSLDSNLQKEFGRDRIRSYSLMSWGEHCTECAFPSCYTTCSFYQPRQDGRCRRFVHGICRVDSPKSWMGYSAYVEFKNWSQLWTQGNATQLPGVLTMGLQLAGTAAWALSAPLDKLLQRLTGRKRLSVALQSLRRRIIRGVARLYQRFPKPDCLLIEIFNPMQVEVQLQLRLRSMERPARYEWTDRAGTGFSSFAIPLPEVEHCDLSRPFEMALTLAEEEKKTVYFCSATFIRLAAKPQPLRDAVRGAGQTGQRKVKCVVWDLDNTLWDGILVEGTAADLKLKDGLRSVLTELDRRGILLSIASKNAEEDARKVLEALGIWELFLVPQINWQPKSASIKHIAERLNIGLDSLAFVDDMPFERDEVATALPMVRITPAEQALALLGWLEFAGDASGEGASRRLMYKTEMRRGQAMADAGLSFDSFLATCGIQICIKRPDDSLLPRIHDIVQRTNQLNIASQRYEMEEIKALIHSEECHCYIVSCVDKYGDYGHIGFIVVALQQGGILIRDCMFSCRVQGKRIDEAVLTHLINHYLRNGATWVQARFNATKRNAPSGEMLARVGFKANAQLEKRLALEPLAPRQEVEFVQIKSDLS